LSFFFPSKQKLIFIPRTTAIKPEKPLVEQGAGSSDEFGSLEITDEDFNFFDMVTSYWLC
jgi:hypothetical protein